MYNRNINNAIIQRAGRPAGRPTGLSTNVPVGLPTLSIHSTAGITSITSIRRPPLIEALLNRADDSDSDLPPLVDTSDDEILENPNSEIRTKDSPPINSECPVCNNDKLEITLHCSHGFHTDCIRGWISQCQRNRKIPDCPLCRSDI